MRCDCCGETDHWKRYPGDAPPERQAVQRAFLDDLKIEGEVCAPCFVKLDIQGVAHQWSHRA